MLSLSLSLSTTSTTFFTLPGQRASADEPLLLLPLFLWPSKSHNTLLLSSWVYHVLSFCESFVLLFTILMSFIYVSLCHLLSSFIYFLMSLLMLWCFCARAFASAAFTAASWHCRGKALCNGDMSYIYIYSYIICDIFCTRPCCGKSPLFPDQSPEINQVTGEVMGEPGISRDRTFPALMRRPSFPNFTAQPSGSFHSAAIFLACTELPCGFNMACPPWEKPFYMILQFWIYFRIDQLWFILIFIFFTSS